MPSFRGQIPRPIVCPLWKSHSGTKQTKVNRPLPQPSIQCIPGTWIDQTIRLRNPRGTHHKKLCAKPLKSAWWPSHSCGAKSAPVRQPRGSPPLIVLWKPTADLDSALRATSAHRRRLIVWASSERSGGTGNARYACRRHSPPLPTGLLALAALAIGQ
jgi:hypothetical protein